MIIINFYFIIVFVIQVSGIFINLYSIKPLLYKKQLLGWTKNQLSLSANVYIHDIEEWIKWLLIPMGVNNHPTHV